VTVGAGEVVGPGEPADGTTQSWSVVATAVCAVAPPGLEIVSAHSGTEPAGVRTAQVDAFCPGTKIMLGAGAALSQGFGQISIRALLLRGGSAKAIASDDEDHFSGAWSLTTYAICADRGPDVENVSFNHGLGSPSSASINTFCSQGKRAISAGWYLQDGEQSLATGAYFQFDNVVQVAAHEDASGFGGLWDFAAEAICATP
jgi:hypothetical protein